MRLPPATFHAFKTIELTCEREGLLPKGAVIVAGVSGGVDSMLLLAFLEDRLTARDNFLVVCHLNHQIRGAEADLDEELVRSYCQEKALPFVSVLVDVPAYAKTHRLGLEQAGRQVRRETLERIGSEYAVATGSEAGFRIALAHHLDDRAESIILHLGRGSGLAGLIGIRYLDGPYIRPLLDLRREELVRAAEALDLPWREDRSNLSDDFLRNRIRNRLLPVWEEILGHDPAPPLVRLGQWAEKDEAALDQLARDLYREASLSDGCLSLASLLSMPEALAARVLQNFFSEQAGTGGPIRSLTADQVDQLIRLATAVLAGEKEKASLSLPGGVEARLADGRLWLSARIEGQEAFEEAQGAAEEK